jgi:hypothetical protein
VAITVVPIVAKPGSTQYHGWSELEPVYMLSLHTSAEEVCYVEMKQ